MCGIVGFVATNPLKEFKNAEQLQWAMRSLMVDVTTRGLDAGGYAGVDPSGGMVVAKQEGPLFELSKAEIVAMECSAFIAHARLATHGDEKDNKNNHPFVSRDGKLAMVHNGIIYNYARFGSDNDGDCDSESILRQIERAKEGSLAKRIASGIKPLNGYMSCAMVDSSQPNSLYLFRADGGISAPLNTVKLGNVTLFASTAEMLFKAINLTRLGWGRKKPLEIVEEEDDIVITLTNGGKNRSELELEITGGNWYGNMYDDDPSYMMDSYYGGTSGLPTGMGSKRVARSGGGVLVYRNSEMYDVPSFYEYELAGERFIPTRSAIDSEGKNVMVVTE